MKDDSSRSIRRRALRTALLALRLPFVLSILMLILTGIVLTLYHVHLEPVLYSAVLLLFLFAGIAFFRCENEYRLQQQRELVLKQLPEAFPALPDPRTAAETDYQAMIKLLEQRISVLTAERDASRREMNDYYTTWVHQIKTPIAVMRLILQREDTEENRALSAELFRTEQYVEMALSYTRLESESSDLVIQEYSLDELVRTAIRKYASQFIYRKLRLVYEPTDRVVVTDKKWFLCILEQLLSNAIKYTPQGSITISVTEAGDLVVSDTGIGIDPGDLPRIFEKGFTGINGRSEQKSTGLGLYLCKRAADQIGVSIHPESTPGEGTSFRLSFPVPGSLY